MGILDVTPCRINMADLACIFLTIPTSHGGDSRGGTMSDTSVIYWSYRVRLVPNRSELSSSCTVGILVGFLNGLGSNNTHHMFVRSLSSLLMVRGGPSYGKSCDRLSMALQSYPDYPQCPSAVSRPARLLKASSPSFLLRYASSTSQSLATLGPSPMRRRVACSRRHSVPDPGLRRSVLHYCLLPLARHF
ncbi:hypothetical protein BD311DRAFT_89342 [Dichomitus squalens]|uniref:Uncharacterized protein n=1 Tax=Dichomitus squalens TaxID=114155 RepID=A0A4V2JZ13_9APHY|nr:hypothetical protein BD311DRAFT_89342 [Dichomitus squalens]